VPVVADCAAVTPLGGTLRETWDALLAGRFIEEHGRVPVGMAGGLPRVVQLALLAAGKLGPLIPYVPLGASAGRVGIVVGTSKGPVDAWLARDTPAVFDGLESARVDLAGLGEIADRVGAQYRLSGPRVTVSAACASGLHALARGVMMIRSGEARDVLVVAAESSLHPLFVGSFQRLGVLAREGGCRPFDKRRQGFVMSEAAAAVWLFGVPQDEVSLNSTAQEASWGPRIAVEDVAIGGDATHLTGGDPQGRLLRRLAARVLGDGPVDLVHAHGTGTEANDPVELAALDDCCAGQLRPPALYSHKGALGHSLGASGLVSVVLNWKAHLEGVVPPNVRTREPLAARHLSIEQGAQRRRVRRSLVVAAGFGGATAAATLRTMRPPRVH
jgi:3-oxoacyl-[acyl-carrier-protein] synthase II